MTPAEELRAAAATLREHATDATKGPWWTEDTSPAHWGDNTDAKVACADGTIATLHPESNGPLNADWMALMDPGMGPLLADWLDGAARTCDATVTAAGRVWPLPCDEAEAFIQEQVPHAALAVARAINTKAKEQR